ncbi:MAG: hypothetical protein VYA34_14045 [Myxococcota bacterium]|nr:hypothetical protein [Myxococcota bacterium]
MIRVEGRGKGISVESLGVVLAACCDMNPIFEFEGNPQANNGRGMLLDVEKEEVVWCTDRVFFGWSGYNPRYADSREVPEPANGVNRVFPRGFEKHRGEIQK